MKIRLSLVAGALMALTLGAGAAMAAMQGKVFFEVAFAFNAGNLSFPAGRYEVQPGKPNQGDLTIRSVATGKAVVVPATSRLASRNIPHPEMVFDQAGDKMHLSEVHLPDSDGYYIAGAKGEHSHKTVKGTK